FFFNTKDVDVNRRISLNYRNIAVSELLSVVFNPMGTDYEIHDRKIFLKKGNGNKIQVNNKSPETTLPVQFQVEGVVRDGDGLPLPGANIIEKGTTNGVVADFDGNFAIQVSNAQATLVVSYIGYTTSEIRVDNQSLLEIVLRESAATLDEVVVMGYGTQSRRKVTAAVSKVDGEKLENIPINSLGDGLKGKVAGLRTYTTNNEP